MTGSLLLWDESLKTTILDSIGFSGQDPALSGQAVSWDTSSDTSYGDASQMQGQPFWDYGSLMAGTAAGATFGNTLTRDSFGTIASPDLTQDGQPALPETEDGGGWTLKSGSDDQAQVPLPQPDGMESASFPTYTMQQIADYLREGYWTGNGSTARSFNVGVDNQLTYNLDSLDLAYVSRVLIALETWSDITGIQFVEVASASSAEIVFESKNSNMAETTHTLSGSTITKSTIEISSDWAGLYGGDDTLQTMIHEVGHALGLGEAGNYDRSAVYGTDNHYANDSWQASIMSYFSQTENTSVSASFAYVLTPMLADILAITDIYGAGTTTRTGDSVYGYNTNLTETRFGASVLDDAGTNYTLTIVDHGGSQDVIDLSGSSHDNIINLTPGSVSSTGGLIGNLSIAEGTMIERAIGGSGNDTLTGNTGNNYLTGNGGNDTLIGGGGHDIFVGGVGDDILQGGTGEDWAYYFDATAGVVVQLFNLDGIQQNTIGAGRDTLIGIDHLAGSSFDDRLIGDAGNNSIGGNRGNDTIDGVGGSDHLYGASGNDGFRARGGDTYFDGGADIDFVNFDASTGVNVFLDSSYGTNGRAAVGDTFVQIENIIGSPIGDDLIYGDAADNRLTGLGGNDTLRGLDGVDQLEGGDGNDLLIGDAGSDVIVTGTGLDTVWLQQTPIAGERDRITDFESGSDTLRIDASAFGGGLVAGGSVILETVSSVTGTTATTSSGTFLYDNIGSGAGFLYYDADGNGTGDAILVAWLQNVEAITASDFELVA